MYCMSDDNMATIDIEGRCNDVAALADPQYRVKTLYVIVSLLSPSDSTLSGNKSNKENCYSLKVWSTHKTVESARQQAEQLQLKHTQHIFFASKVGHWTLWASEEETDHDKLLFDLVNYEREEYEKYRIECQKDIKERIEENKALGSKEGQEKLHSKEHKLEQIKQLEAQIEQLKHLDNKGKSRDDENFEREIDARTCFAAFTNEEEDDEYPKEPENIDSCFLLSYVNHPTIKSKAFKIRGCFNSVKEAQAYQKKLGTYDKTFEILTGAMGKWVTWPTPDVLKKVPKVYRNEQLNELIVGREKYFLENQIDNLDERSQAELSKYIEDRKVIDRQGEQIKTLEQQIEYLRSSL